MPSVLRDHHDHEGGSVGRGVAGEERVVFPRVLRGPGLSGDPDLADSRALSRPAGVHDHFFERRVDEVEIGRGNVGASAGPVLPLGRTDETSVASSNLADHVRLNEGAAVRDQGVETCERERGEQARPIGALAHCPQAVVRLGYRSSNASRGGAPLAGVHVGATSSGVLVPTVSCAEVSPTHSVRPPPGALSPEVSVSQ